MVTAEYNIGPVWSEPEAVAAVLNLRPDWREALAWLLELHRPVVQAYCTKRIGCPDRAQDVVQEAMLRAWRKGQGYQGRAAFRTWLIAIAERQCLDLFRRKGRQEIPDAVRDFLLANESIADADADWNIELGDARRIWDLVMQLPEGAREVIALRFLRDLSSQELADTLGIKLSTAKMRLKRALERLRLMLEAEEPADVAA